MPDVNEHESNETPQTTPNVPPQTAQPQASWQPPETWAAQQPAQAPFQQPMPAQQPLPTPTPQPWAPQQPLPTPPLPGAQSRQQPVNGFTVAGLVLGILAIIVALWAFGDYVSVFGVVGLALGIIGWFYTKDQAAARGEKPSMLNRAIVVVVLVLSLAALIITPIANHYQRTQRLSDSYGYYGSPF